LPTGYASTPQAQQNGDCDMAIQGENFAAVIFLFELRIQCDLFNNSISCLGKVVQRQANRKQGIYDEVKYPPIEIIAQCTACLSSLSTIRRILFTCDRENDDRKNPTIKRNLRNRCSSLMELLGHPVLEKINAPTVRNAWEHIDENLDKYLTNSKYTEIYPVYIVGASEPDQNALIQAMEGPEKA
jgi:hypothetical protein